MKQTKQEAIPVHRMDDHVPQGIKFRYMEVAEGHDEAIMKSQKNMIHRDDYYLFLFLNDAEISLTLDFEDIKLEGNSALYVRPGQVHFISSIRGSVKGWSLAIDAMMVENSCKNTFEGQFLAQRPIVVDASVSARINEVSILLQTVMQEKSTAFSNDIALNLANVFIGMIAEQYADRQESLCCHKSRSSQIAHQFKELLSENFKTIKSPTQYAEKLNYSLSHLNESVKRTTGFPVSFWIHQQVVLEAKRLLYYTDMDVKEIAFSLGYEDHTYFSRLFSKVVSVSPGTFRHKFHK